MTQSFIALLPVFIVILVGYGLRRSELIAEDHWTAVDHVCYYVLFPAIIFKEIAAADFSNVPVWSMALAMILGITSMFALLLALRRPLTSAMDLNGPQFTSLFQGATRWHTFIALAIIPIYFGQPALALGRPECGRHDAASQHRECGGDFGLWFRRQDERARHGAFAS